MNNKKVYIIKRSNGRFEVRANWIDEGGKNRSKTKQCRTEEEAILLKKEWQELSIDGLSADVLPFADFAQYYLKQKERVLSPSSMNITMSKVSKLTDFFDGCYLGKITKADVKSFVAIMSRKYTKAYTKVICITLHEMFELAVDMEILLKNPASKVKVNGLPSKEKRALSPEEIEIINFSYNAVKDGDLVYILLHTGLRIGELAALTMQDLKDGDHCCFLSVTKTIAQGTNGLYVSNKPKTTAGIRTIPISQEVYNLIFKRIVLSRNEYLGEIYSMSTIRKQICRAIEKMGINIVNPHELRHTYSTILHRANTQPLVHAALMGHASYSEDASTYIHIDMNDKIKAFENFVN